MFFAKIWTTNFVHSVRMCIHLLLRVSKRRKLQKLKQTHKFCFKWLRVCISVLWIWISSSSNSVKQSPSCVHRTGSCKGHLKGSKTLFVTVNWTMARLSRWFRRSNFRKLSFRKKLQKFKTQSFKPKFKLKLKKKFKKRFRTV